MIPLCPHVIFVWRVKEKLEKLVMWGWWCCWTQFLHDLVESGREKKEFSAILLDYRIPVSSIVQAIINIIDLARNITLLRELKQKCAEL